MAANDAPPKLTNIFSCDTLEPFIGTVREILSYAGYSDSAFFICEHQGIEFLTKLSLYKKTIPEIYKNVDTAGNPSSAMTNPYDVEIDVLKILKEKIIDANVSPCILELLFYKRCDSIDNLVPKESVCDRHLFEKPSGTARDFINRRLCKHSELVDSGLAHKKFSLLVLEECDITFRDYLNHYIDESPIDHEIFKSLMFQIIYTVYSILSIYPQFHHGDLHCDNIMIKFDPDYVFGTGNPKFLAFHVNGVQYNVPYFGMICKIIDFGFTSIPEENIRSYISQDVQMMFMHSFNDLLFFFYDVYKTAGRHLNVKDFLTSIEPNKTFMHHNTKYIKRIAEKIPTAKDMLASELFEHYKEHVDESKIWHEYKK